MFRRKVRKTSLALPTAATLSSLLPSEWFPKDYPYHVQRNSSWVVLAYGDQVSEQRERPKRGARSASWRNLWELAMTF